MVPILLVQLCTQKDWSKITFRKVLTFYFDFMELFEQCAIGPPCASPDLFRHPKAHIHFCQQIFRDSKIYHYDQNWQVKMENICPMKGNQPRSTRHKCMFVILTCFYKVFHSSLIALECFKRNTFFHKILSLGFSGYILCIAQTIKATK